MTDKEKIAEINQFVAKLWEQEAINGPAQVILPEPTECSDDVIDDLPFGQ